MLLHVHSELLGMCLLQCLNGLIIIFEILKLTLIVLTSLVKLLLDLLQVHLHVLRFFLVLFLQLRLSFLHLLLVHLEVLLAVLPFLQVLLLQLPYLLLRVLAFSKFGDFVLLFQYDFVCLFQNDLHFLLVAATEGLLGKLILLVLGVQLEYHFRQLRDLLRHLVMRLFRDTCVLRHLI